MDPLITRQLCLIGADEHESCSYEGPLCYDGTDIFVVVADGTTGAAPAGSGLRIRRDATSAAHVGTAPADAPSAAETTTGGPAAAEDNSTAADDAYYDPGLGPQSAGGITPNHDSSGRRGPCFDWRTFESVQKCGYGTDAYRDAPPAAASCNGIQQDTSAGIGTSAYAHSCSQALITTVVKGRAWGPDGQVGGIREIARGSFASFTHGNKPLHLFDPTGAHAAAAAGDSADQLLRRQQDDLDVALARNASNALRDSSSGASTYVHWLDGALWLTPMMTAWWGHPYHAASAVFALWHAKRHNASVLHVPRPAAGFGSPPPPDDKSGSTNAAHLHLEAGPWRSASQSLGQHEANDDGAADTSAAAPFAPQPQQQQHHWPESDPRHGLRLSHGGIPFPSMDYFLWTTDPGEQKRYGYSDVSGWLKGAWPLFSQPQTNMLTRDRLQRDLGLGKNTLVCAPRGTVTGVQMRLFSGIADAHAFRVQAWALAGIDVSKQRPYDRYAPRMITILDRPNTRSLVEKERLISIVQATGIRFKYIENIGSLSWADQVKAMAGTGLLISPHGAALTNLIFLPPRAAVLELMPYLLNWEPFRRMAEASNLYYYRVPAPRPWVDADGSYKGTAGTGFELFAGSQAGSFQAVCEDPQRISTRDASLLVGCNGRSKNVKVNLDFSVLIDNLLLAMDDIGCRARQFLPGHAAALRAAQKAIQLAKSHVNKTGDGAALGWLGAVVGAAPSTPAAAAVDALYDAAATAGLGNTTVDAFKPIVERGGVSFTDLSAYEDIGLDWNGGPTLRAMVGLALAPQLGLDRELTGVAFVQPEPGVNRIVNVASRCTPLDAQFHDKSPWRR